MKQKNHNRGIDRHVLLSYERSYFFHYAMDKNSGAAKKATDDDAADGPRLSDRRTWLGM